MSIKTMSPNYMNKMEFVRDRLPRGRGLLLDIGCGYGEYLEIARKQGFRSFGLDLDGSALKGQDGVLVANGEDIPFRGGFDIILCIDMLEHVEDDGRLIAEASRVLKPGGMLILTTPSRHFPFTYDPINALLRNFNRRVGIGIWGWGHRRLYTRNSIRKILEGNSLRIIDYREITHALLAMFINYLPYIFTHHYPNLFARKQRSARGQGGPIRKFMGLMNRLDKRLLSNTRGTELCFVIRKR